MHKILNLKFSFTYPSPRKLREIVQMSLMEKENPEQIKTIWNEYHANRQQNIAMTLSRDQYETLRIKKKQAQMFLLPVKRQGGHFMLISQIQDNSILMTTQDLFMKQAILASPVFIFTFFDELLISKGLCLARGDIIDQYLTREEAQNLMKNYFMFYLNEDLFQTFVMPFNHNSQQFNYPKFAQLLDITPRQLIFLFKQYHLN